MRNTLQNAFEKKDWSRSEGAPRSGRGSTLAVTAPLRAALPGIFERYNVRTFLDAPCGDWTWMQTVDLSGIDYIGGDISSEVVDEVKAEHDAPGRTFIHLDVTSDPLPKADLIMCRDCLFHLKFWLRWAFFENFVKSEIPYLLTTRHYVPVNEPLKNNAGYKQFNPCAEPFNFADPLETILETGEINFDPEVMATPKGKNQRSLGIWSREQVIDALERRQKET